MTTTDRRRQVPPTGEILSDPRVAAATERLGRALVKHVVSECLSRVRAGQLPPDDVVDEVLRTLPDVAATVRRVINATGVLVHTNLGRAPLSQAAVAAMAAAAGAADVEFDLATGRRGRRGRGALTALARAVPQAESVHVVNNNAAALAMVAATFAVGREIIVSRGELVEIGDGFRIPELLVAAGARLREVGTTNRTSLADYRDAIGPDTALIMKVHPSNFVVRGFTSRVPVAELAALGPPVAVDTGSGLLRPEPSLPDEPDVATALRDGADLVMASGDKLLGGPQCGLVFGAVALVERIRRHPLARAARVDKVTLAALEASLRGPEPPVRRMLRASVEEVRERAERLARRLADAGLEAAVQPSEASVGGGAAPDVALPSYAVTVPVDLAELLRAGRPAVVGHVDRDRLLLDVRSVDPADDEALAAAVVAAAGR
ncbi:MAG: L-seryl-tRNA(Sec) selenium transferase [Micromonosporaceae bacterium]|nr:L-seryl-tRNA(Sec) selenium transferase [Micromonosporaceae bacterium]